MPSRKNDFGGDPILEPIFDFCERTGDLLHPSEQSVIRRTNGRKIRRVKRAVKHPI